MNPPSKKVYSKKNIKQAFGVGVILFALLCLLSPATQYFYHLSYGIAFLFGIEGFYLLVPFIMFAGFVLAITGSLEKPDVLGRVGYGYILFLLGLGMLWSHLGLKGTENSADVSIFKTALADVLKTGEPHPFIRFYTANQLGGGIVGYFFSAVFYKIGLWLLILLAVLLTVGGLLIVFFPLVKKLFVLLKTKAKISSAHRRSEKEAAAQNQAMAESYESPVTDSPVTEAPSEAPLLSRPREEEPIRNPLPSLAAPSPEAYPSRRDLNAQPIPSPLPQDLTTPEVAAQRIVLSPSQLAQSGLQEAVFIPSDDMPVYSRAPSTPTPAVSAPLSNEIPVNPPSNPSASVKPAPLPEPSFSNEVNLNEEPAPAMAEAIPETRETISPAPSASAPTPIAPDPASIMPEPALSAPNEPETAAVEPEPVIPEVPTAQEAAPVEPSPAPVPPKKPEPSNPVNQPDAVDRPPYTFPDVELLNVYQDEGREAEQQQACQATQATIDQTLSDFKVGAHVEGFTIGPSVTRYNIKCDPNVSVTSIDHYVSDISQRLNGAPTRFQAVVRGQATSGLEIPNAVRTKVSLKEVIMALPHGPKDNMQVPFGKMINGKYLAGDLTSFPHMLVAGSTGSGKSVFMHGVIMSLIMRNRPEDLKLVLIDPKRVEMGCYRDIPHLLCPIIKDPSQAKVCLDKLIIEMERRYSLFEWSGVRDIRQFNASFAPSHKLSPLPFIVVVVDEYADLVDTCKNVSDSVVRLAQKARAAGIHLIISTQRPSVDVITGVIKGNLSCRVALRVNSYVDSNTILGCGGAEGLSGYGDMLVDCQTAFQGGFSRAQGAIVDTEEIDKVCTFIKSQVPTVYDPNFLDLVDHEAEAEEEEAAAESMTPTHADIKAEDDEEFYQQLKAEIMTRQYTSISRIQREHGLGFPRAGRLFNRLVKEGVVAAEPNPPGSSKGCQVLIHADSNTGEVPGSTDASLKPGEDLHHGEQ